MLHCTLRCCVVLMRALPVLEQYFQISFYFVPVRMQVACSTSHQPAVLQMFKDGGGFQRLRQLLQWTALTFRPRERGLPSIRTARSQGSRQPTVNKPQMDDSVTLLSLTGSSQCAGNCLAFLDSLPWDHAWLACLPGLLKCAADLIIQLSLSDAASRNFLVCHAGHAALCSTSGSGSASDWP